MYVQNKVREKVKNLTTETLNINLHIILVNCCFNIVFL